MEHLTRNDQKKRPELKQQTGSCWSNGARTVPLVSYRHNSPVRARVDCTELWTLHCAARSRVHPHGLDFGKLGELPVQVVVPLPGYIHLVRHIAVLAVEAVNDVHAVAHHLADGRHSGAVQRLVGPVVDEDLVHPARVGARLEGERPANVGGLQKVILDGRHGQLGVRRHAKVRSVRLAHVVEGRVLQVPERDHLHEAPHAPRCPVPTEAEGDLLCG
mmetsp:Transcript_166215/g.403828  ORF Transcript_166215/g.403828 Transcript_166215/m.403828 type:complete len:217 (+) Transcript_166215:95-745(+)